MPRDWPLPAPPARFSEPLTVPRFVHHTLLLKKNGESRQRIDGPGAVIIGLHFRGEKGKP